MSIVWMSSMRDTPTPPRSGASASETSNVRHLQQQVDRLEMICEAMWSLLRDKVGESDEALMAKVLELDLSDGQADGKVARGPQKCPNCNRPNSRRHEFCIYCGQPIRKSAFG
ncbi:zinc ribbon domain-containing protein [Planctomycetales bacterium ZRK34]|nr:zinc ribbon domain-containing protein [Planctomycetales bacterium ZRK34]